MNKFLKIFWIIVLLLILLSGLYDYMQMREAKKYFETTQYRIEDSEYNIQNIRGEVDKYKSMYWKFPSLADKDNFMLKLELKKREEYLSKKEGNWNIYFVTTKEFNNTYKVLGWFLYDYETWKVRYNLPVPDNYWWVKAPYEKQFLLYDIFPNDPNWSRIKEKKEDLRPTTW